MQVQGPVTVLTGGKAAARDEQKEQAQEYRLQVESKISKIRVARLAMGNAKVPRPNFDLGADLKETSRSDTELRLNYILYLDAFPAVQRIEMHGQAVVRSPVIKSYTDNDELDESLLSEVAVEIFRNHYGTVYLLFDSMRLPAPSPWVVKDVHLV